MEVLWDIVECILGILWVYCGNTEGILWKFIGFTVEIVWQFSGNAVKWCWNTVFFGDGCTMDVVSDVGDIVECMLGILWLYCRDFVRIQWEY